MPSPGILVLIADDHPIFRRGLREVIETAAGIRVVAEAACGEEALVCAAMHKPDIAILDIDMPRGDGFVVARTLRNEFSSIKVIFLTLYHDEMNLHEALDAGAGGYLVKDSAAADVVDCIRTVAAGKHYVSPKLSSFLLNRTAGKKGWLDRANGCPGLTPAERLIVRELAHFKTNKEIASALDLSVRTVENHRANICEKLGLQGAHALVRFAMNEVGGWPKGVNQPKTTDP